MADDLMLEALEVMGLVSAGDHQATPEEIEKWRLKALEEVAGLTGGEEAVAAANFKQVGAKGEPLPPDFGDRSGDVRARLARQEGLGAAPPRQARAAAESTDACCDPKRLYAFDASYRYSMRKQKREQGRPVEVASWDRDGGADRGRQAGPDVDAADRAARGWPGDYPGRALDRRRSLVAAGDGAARSQPDLGKGPLMGLFFKRTKPTADLASDGIRCRATVEHADMLGRGSSHFNLSSDKAESIVRGDETPLRFKVRLRVEPTRRRAL